jgi:hypothetical protein
VIGQLDETRAEPMLGQLRLAVPGARHADQVDLRMVTPVEVIEVIPRQPRGARSSARTFSPHITRPVSVKP